VQSEIYPHGERQLLQHLGLTKPTEPVGPAGSRRWPPPILAAFVPHPHLSSEAPAFSATRPPHRNETAPLTRMQIQLVPEGQLPKIAGQTLLEPHGRLVV
jgi:hypothetical protein